MLALEVPFPVLSNAPALKRNDHCFVRSKVVEAQGSGVLMVHDNLVYVLGLFYLMTEPIGATSDR